MSFFNPKEEVINIELTQYGKELFSKGEFDPRYYSFFDDEIIYDFAYASSINEQQNDIETRILEETPYIKSCTILSDKEKTKRLGSLTNKNYKKDSIPVATGDSLTNYTPSWHVKFLESSGSFINNTQDNILNIYINDKGTKAENYLNIKLTGNNLDNINIVSDTILLEIEENNSISNKENFEIELYEVDQNNEENVSIITFAQDPIYVVDGILLDKPILQQNIPELNPEYAEYYFTISADKKIDSLTLEKIKNQTKNLYNNS